MIVVENSDKDSKTATNLPEKRGAKIRERHRALKVVETRRARQKIGEARVRFDRNCKLIAQGWRSDSKAIAQ
jgi:hypothetical protein